MVDETRFDFLDELHPEDLKIMVEALERGDKSPAAAFGFGPEHMNYVLELGTTLYREGHYEQAAQAFGAMLGLDRTQHGAWRGLGACCQALKQYDLAILCYQSAVVNNPQDVAAEVFSAECFIHRGDTQAAMNMLDGVILRGTEDPEMKPYLTRARTLRKAEGRMPSSLRIVAEQASKDAAAAAKAVLADAAAADASREITFKDMKAHPKLGPLFEDLLERIKAGTLTYGEVGGFTELEYKAAYGIACRYVETDQIIEALHVLGFLMFLEPYRADFNQLMGIAMQRIAQYGMAIRYYERALDQGDEPRSLIFLGECQITQGDREEGLQNVTKGLALAEPDPELADLVERANTLIRRYSEG